MTKSKAGNIAGSWNRWSKEWRWEERFDAYDRDQHKRLDEVRKQAQREDHARKLEQYRKAHEDFGVDTFNVMLLATRAIKNELKKYVPTTPGETAAKEINSVRDAKDLASIISCLSREGRECWGEALGMPELMEAMEESQSNAQDA